MEYKVSYDKKEYNLNAIISFDLLKEILYKLLISQDKFEKELDKIKNSNIKRDKDMIKLEKLIKENLAFDEEFSDENPEINIAEEQEIEEVEYKDKNKEQLENTPQRQNEDKSEIDKKEEDEEKEEKEEKEDKEEKEETSYIINEIKNKEKEDKKDFRVDEKQNNFRGEQIQYKEENKNVSKNNIDNDNADSNKDNENNAKETDNKDDDFEKTEKNDNTINEKNDIDLNKEKETDKIKVGSQDLKKEETNKKREKQEHKIENQKKANNEIKRINNIQLNQNYNQIPPDLIRNMAKQIKDNKKKLLDIQNHLKKEIKSNYEILKKDFQKTLKDHNMDNQKDIKGINSKLVELFQAKEDLESKMEDCISKCSSIDIYNMFKDSGDGTVDAAKVLVRSLEEKVFKKLEFVDTRYKKDALDNMKMKNNVDSLMPNVEKLNRDMEKMTEIFEKNNEEIDNMKKDFEDQKNEIKNLDEDKNNMLNRLDNLNNDIQNTINNEMKTKIEELEKKIDEIRKNNEGSSDLFKLGFGNKNIDEEAVQVLEKKITDLRKKMNDLEFTLKMKNQDIEEMQNETKNMKINLDKKIAREDLKELYNMHLSDLDEINDLKDNAGVTFDEIRKAKSEITNILQKIDSINGNIVLLQNNNNSNAGRRASISSMINFEKYIDQQKLNETLKPLLKEIEKIYREVESITRNISDYESNFKTFAKNDRVDRLEDEINTKINEVKTSSSKKFVDKVEFVKNVKQLEIQIKSMDLENKRSEGDSWIMAKKPVGCFNCASCEANIKNVNPSNEYLAWNKYPQQDKIYRMGQGFSHMLQMMTSEFVKSIGNAEKENEIDFTSRSNNLAINPNLIFEKSQLINDNNERKQSASVLKINNKEQISEELLKKINNFNLNISKSKGKVQLPRVLKFKKKLKIKNDGINNVPVSDDEYTGRNNSMEREGFKDNTSPKILKIMKKKPFVKTEENLNFTQVNNTKY